MFDIVWLLTGLVCWLSAAHRLRSAYRTGVTPAGLSLAWALVFLAVAFTIQITAIRTGIDRVGPRPETAQHLGQLCVLAAAFSSRMFLVLINHPPEQAHRMVARRALILTLTVATLVAMFLSSDRTAPALEQKMLSARGLGAVYLVTYAGYIAVSALEITRLTRRYARWADSDFLRLGLQAISLGGAGTLAYALAKIGLTVARTYADRRLASVEFAVIRPLMFFSGVLVATGLAFPALGPRIPGLRRLVGWQAQYRCYRILHPLWRALVHSTPEIALHRSSRGLRSRLYRRVIEINDGLLALRPHRDARVEQLAATGAAGDLDATARQAVIEAAAIACALRAKAYGRRHTTTTTTPQPDDGDLDLDHEARRLQLVALAFRHSPIVAAVTAQTAGLDAEATHTDDGTPLSPGSPSDEGEPTR